MSLTAQERTRHAQIAALARHYPDAYARRVEALRIEKSIADLVAAAPKMTPEQAERVLRLFRYVAAPANDATPG